MATKAEKATSLYGLTGSGINSAYQFNEQPISSFQRQADERKAEAKQAAIAQAAQSVQATAPSGDSYTITDAFGRTYNIVPASMGGYMRAYEQYANDRKNQMDVQQSTLLKTLEQNNATTNTNYDNSARQAYVDYMRKQRALPSQLQALGVRGGATESGLLNLYNNYGSSHAANEQQRNADLTSNQNNYEDAYNTAYQNYLADLNEQKQTAINNQINEYNNEITRFSSAVAQYPSTLAGYNAYMTWINNLSWSNDPLKDIKVALVRQQVASQFPNGMPSSEETKSSGSSSKKSSGSSSNKSSGSSNKKSSGGNSAAVAAVNAAQTKGQSMTDYYKNLLNNQRRTPNLPTR